MKSIIKFLLIFSLCNNLYSENLGKKDRSGRTPLVNAIISGNVHQALTLIPQMNFAELNIQDSNKYTALMWIIQTQGPKENIPSVLGLPESMKIPGIMMEQSMPSLIMEQSMPERFGRFELSSQTNRIKTILEEEAKERTEQFKIPFKNNNVETILKEEQRRNIYFTKPSLSQSSWINVIKVLVNAMDQLGLNIQDKWGNTALIWAVEKNWPEAALVIVPKMSFPGLLMKDSRGNTVLEKINTLPSWHKSKKWNEVIPLIKQTLKNGLTKITATVATTKNSQKKPTSTPSAVQNVDIVEEKFGDFLVPFALPPAQEVVKSDMTSKNGFKKQNLIGADLSNHDWSNTDFTGANLTNADFSDSIVTNAIFQDANLQGANFEGSNITTDQLLSAKTFMEAWFGKKNQFQNANFKGKILSGCSFENCNLSGVVFDHTSLQGANFTNTNLTGASFKFSQFDSSTLFNSSILDKADFSNSSLTFAQLKQALSYSQVTLTKCNFSQQSLQGINFSNCNLTGINLKGSDCSFANFSRATISAKELEDTASLESTNLSFLNLNNLNYQKKSLAHAYIRGSSFQNANLKNSNLEGIAIINSDFSKAQFEGANMNKPLLYNSNFTAASFGQNANNLFKDINLGTCNVEGTIFQYSNLSPSFFDDKTLLDKQLNTIYGPNIFISGSTWKASLFANPPVLNLTTTKDHLILFPFNSSALEKYTYITPHEWNKSALPNVSFYSMAYLNPQTKSDLKPTSVALVINNQYPNNTLTLTTQSGKISSGTFYPWMEIGFNLYFKTPVSLNTLTGNNNQNYSSQNLASQVLSESTFNNCNFSHTNLQSASMKKSDFTGSNFSHANLNQADIRNSTFANTNCSYATMWAIMTNATFTNATLDHASFAWSTGFTGTQLMQANKNHPGIDLQQLENFQHNSFSGRDFSGGNISSANFSFSSCDNCNFSSTTARYTICNNTNFQQSNLSDAVFDNAILTKADFRGADLSKTSFKGADLRQAIFSSHDQLKTAITDQTTQLDKVLNIK